MKRVYAIAVCVMMSMGCISTEPQKDLNLTITCITPDGQPLNKHLKEARLYRSTDATETDPENMTLVGTVAIPTPTGFVDGKPWQYTFEDIDRGGSYWFRWLATDQANHVGGLSDATPSMPGSVEK